MAFDRSRMTVESAVRRGLRDSFHRHSEDHPCEIWRIGSVARQLVFFNTSSLRQTFPLVQIVVPDLFHLRVQVCIVFEL
jgi:hypothetical protein